jgi:DNA-binding GntR family transcriptional regulator
MELNHRTLSDNVYSVIRRMILNGTFQPGERINQVALAQQLNISRGPLREALRMLQNEGLIRHETNRGTFVSTLSDQDAWEIFTLRGLLEGEAARLAMEHLTEADHGKLEELLRDFEHAFLARDLEQMAHSDLLFHQTIVGASRHGRLQQMHQQLDIQIGAMFVTMASQVPIRVGQAVENHRVLLDALRSKDAGRVKQEFSDHYLDALRALQRHRDKEAFGHVHDGSEHA